MRRRTSDDASSVIGREIEAISQSDCSFIHDIVRLLSRTLQSTPGYDTVIQRTWVMAAGRNFAFKIAATAL